MNLRLVATSVTIASLDQTSGTAPTIDGDNQFRGLLISGIAADRAEPGG